MEGKPQELRDHLEKSINAAFDAQAMIRTLLEAMDQDDRETWHLHRTLQSAEAAIAEAAESIGICDAIARRNAQGIAA